MAELGELAALFRAQTVDSTSRPLKFQTLEDRILLNAAPVDAAAVAPVPEMVQTSVVAATTETTTTDDAHSFSVPAVDPRSSAAAESEQNDNFGWDESTSDEVRQEVVFLDRSVDGWQQVLDDLWSNGGDARELDVVLLSSSRDGIDQISDALATRNDVDAIHIISHGTSGAIQLGSTTLTNDTFAQYAGEFAAWGAALSGDADLLLYGCDLASTADGRALVEKLGTLCDCDVAASTDVTGHVDLDGDWDLEFVEGQIETSIAVSDDLIAAWYGTLDITTNLFAHYEFEENGGGTATDSTSNNNDGALSNSPTWSSDAAVGSFSLDFTGDSVNNNAVVTVPDDSSLDFGTDVTIAFWYNASVAQSDSTRIIGTHDGGDGFSIFADSDGTLNWFLDDGNDTVTLSTAGFISDGNWHHVAAVRNGTTNAVRIYIDGVSQFSGTATDINIVNSTAPLTIGGENAFISDYEGLLDDVRLYDRELASGDVSELYALGTTTSTITVTTTNDTVDGDTSDVASLLASRGVDGFISLREAVLAVNNDSTGHTIDLAAGTYTLSAGVGDTLGDLDIRQSVTITGAGAGSTTINANAGDRVIDALAGTFSLQDVTLTDGSGSGAGINIAGGATANLERVVVDSNTASSTSGGGIRNAGTVILNDVVVSNNNANSASGGGLHNSGTAVITNSLFVGNAASSGSGGGIQNTASGTLNLTNVTISGNAATAGGPGGLNNAGTGSLTNVTITNNSNGGFSSSNGVFAVTNSIIAGNAGSDASGSYVDSGSNIIGTTAGLNLDALADNGGFSQTHALLSGSVAINAGSNSGAPSEDQRGVVRDATNDIGAFEYQANGLGVGLVGHYELNEGSGTTAVDSSSSSNDGTLINGPTYVDGVAGSALQFSNASDQVAVPDPANDAFDFGTGDFSVGFWAKNPDTGDTTYPFLVSKIDIFGGGSRQGFEFYWDNGFGSGLNFKTWTGGVDIGPGASAGGGIADDGEWHHVVGVRQGTTLELYVDGVLAGTKTHASIGDVDNTHALTFGQDGGNGERSNASLDSVRLYDRALAANEITALANERVVVVDTTSDTNDAGLVGGNSSHDINYLYQNRGSDSSISLREAIIAANNTVGTDTIEFEIGDALVSGLHTITLTSALPAITDAVIINATTDGDSAGTPVIALDGSDTVGHGFDLGFNADGSTIRGFLIQNFTSNGIQIDGGSDGHTIAGNWIGSFDAAGDDAGVTFKNAGYGIFVGGANNVIGGSSAADRNVISGNNRGIVIDGATATGNRVFGNYIGSDVGGSRTIGNDASGISVESGATGNFIGSDLDGTNDADEGNVIIASGNNGILFWDAATTGNTVAGNLIGVGADGVTLAGNQTQGIQIGGGANANTIGGTAANAGNVIADSRFSGIEILNAGSDHNIIQGNFIGTDATGTLDFGNGTLGIYINDDAQDTMIGGIGTDEGNIIAFNSDDGVGIEGTNTIGHSIRGNRIYGNGDIGIDLGGGGLDSESDNDSSDIDMGGNRLQNWAIVKSASIADDGSFAFDLDTRTLAAGNYSIDFYASTEGNLGDNAAGDQAQGERYLFSATNVPAGDSAFDATAPFITAAAGEYLTITVTDASGNTSEFSNAVVITDADGGGAPPSDLSVVSTSAGGLTINADGGNDTYLEADDGGAIVGGLTNFTLEARVTLGAAPPSFPHIIDYATSSEDRELSLLLSGDTVRVTIADNIVGFAGTYSELRDGNEHTISVTKTSGGVLKLYIDGDFKEQLTGINVGHTIASGGDLVIGNDLDHVEGFSTLQYVEGTLHDIRIFSDVRTDSEIASNYRSELPFDEANMVANWRFDQLSADGVVTESVAGNNLTIKHTAESGFSTSVSQLTLSVDEDVANGTVVGVVEGTDAERDALIGSLLAGDSDLFYSAESGKFYKAISTGVDWSTAQGDAIASTLNTIGGQLATIRSATEFEFVRRAGQAVGAGGVWLGASDTNAEGEWRWYDGLNSDDQFADAAGDSVGGSYVAFGALEPSGEAAENHLEFDLGAGQWNDLDGAATRAYVIEWNADDVLDATEALTYTIAGQTEAGAFAIDADSGQITVANTSLLDAVADPTHTLSIQVNDADGNLRAENVSVAIASKRPTDIATGVALNTNGGNDAFFAAADADFLLGAAGHTYEVTFSGLSAPVGQSTFYSQRDPGTAQSYFAVLPNGQLDWAGIASTATFSELLDGDLHTVAVTWTAATGDIDFYVDGVFRESRSVAPQAGSTGGPTFVLGQHVDFATGLMDPDDAFQGTLHDFRVWDHARSASEIADNDSQLFDATNLPSGLLANWQMTELAGAGNDTLVDLVNPGGNDLTLQNASGGGFTAGTASDALSVVESASLGTRVGYARGADPDFGETLTYSLADDDGGRFAIDSVTGEITLADGSMLDFETNTSHDITVRVTDSSVLSYNEVVTIQLTDVNEPPVVSAISNQTITEDTATVTLAFSVNDPETAAGSLVVTATSSNQTLIPDGNISIGGSGSDRTINLLPASNEFGGPATITISVSDGVHTTQSTFDVTVTPVNDPPVFSTTNSIRTFATGGPAVTLFSGTSVDPVESGDLIDELVVQVSGLADGSDERLVIDGTSIALTNGNVAVTSGNTYGVVVIRLGSTAQVGISLSGGTANAAQNLVDGLAYENLNASPQGASRTVTLSSITDDGGGSDTTAIGVSSVVAMNASTSPTFTVPISQSVGEDTPLTFSNAGGNPIVVGNVADAKPITATLSVTSGTLTLGGTTGISFLNGTANGDATLTIVGSQADVNTALDGLTYLPTLDYSGTDSLSITTGSSAAIETSIHARYEFTAGATTDSSGKGRDGVATGNPTLTNDAERGDVLTFDGDDTVAITNGVLGLGDEVTFSAWVNLDAGQQENVFLSIGDEFYVTLDRTDASHSMAVHANSFTSNSLDAADNIAGEGWNHVAATFDDVDKELHLYLNGELVRSTTFGFSDVDWGTATSPNITIGALSDGTNGFSGSLDDVRIYSDELTQAEIVDIMGDHGEASSSVSIAVLPDGVQHSLPTAQATDQDTPLTFSAAGGNAVTVDDGTAATDTRLQVWLGVQGFNGTITLSQTTGLTFPGGSNGSSSMVLWGTEADINAALDGAVFTPNLGYAGSADINVETKLAADLQGHYRFENAGDLGQDTSVGVLQNGTPRGSGGTNNEPQATFDATRGNVVDLDGVDDDIVIPDTFGSPSSITLAAWVNATNGYGELFSFDDRLTLRVDDPNASRGVTAIYHNSHGFQVIPSGKTIANTGWRHLALTFDGSTNEMSLYIDGSLAAQNSYLAGIDYTGGDITIGSNQGNSLFLDGLVDDARVYTRALNGDEILSLANDLASVSGTVSLEVGVVNTAPEITLLDNDFVSVTNDGSATTLDAAAAVQVIDTTSSNFDGGSLQVTGVGFDALDLLGIDTSGSLTLSAGLTDGSTISVGRTEIGTLSSTTNDGFTVVLNTNASATNVATLLQSITFESTATTYGDRTVNVTLNDGDGTANFGADTATASTIVNVAAANDGSVATSENTMLTLSAADFDFTGIVGSDLLSITVTALPASGTLQLSGANVALNQIITKADIDAGNLTFVPAANATGSPYASFEFTVNNGNQAVTVLPGDTNIYTIGAGQLAPMTEILSSTSNFGPSGTYPTRVLYENQSSTIDASYLAQGEIYFDGFVADASLTVGELAALDAWVTAGGILISTNDTATHDPIGTNYGLTIGGNGSATWQVVDAAHEIMNGPFGLVGNVGDTFSAAGSISYFDSASLALGDVILATDSVSGEPTIVLRQHGAGWILFTSDEGIFRANTSGSGTITTANDRLAANVFAWAIDQVAPATYQMDVMVSTANNAPTVGSGSLTAINEDDANPPGDTIANLVGGSFADVDSGSSMSGIVVTSNNSPISEGVWQYSTDGGTNWFDVGATGTNGVTLSASSHVRFAPASNFNGAATIISFRALDDTYSGGFTAGASKVFTDTSSPAGGSPISSSLASIAQTVTAVNDAALVATNNPLTVGKGSTGNVIGTGLLNEGDPDDAGAGLTYRVNNAVVNGTLRRLGVALVSGNTFTQEDIDLNRITYDHDGTNTTSDSFTFSLNDGGENGTTPVSDTFSIAITTTNSAPVITSGPGGGTYFEGSSGTYFNNGLTLIDADSGDFDGGTITVTLTTAGEADDRLIVRDGNNVSVAGSTVAYDFGGGPVTIGTFTGGSGLTPLAVTFNSNATVASVEAVAQQVAFRTVSDTPSSAQRGLSMVVTDGDGGTSNTANRVMNVVAVNDTPTFDNLSGSTATYTEGGTAVVLDNDVQLLDAELNAADSFGNATLTLQRSGGPNSDDVYSATGTITTFDEGDDIVMSGVTIGALDANSGGVLLVSFYNTATSNLVNEFASQLAYSNTSSTPPGNVQINWTFNDGNTGTQGTGGVGSVIGSTNVTINATNSAPTMTPIANQSINEDSTTGPLAFSVSDAETPVTSLIVTATSNHQAILPDANLTLVDLGGGNWTIEATPVANTNGGPVTITVTADDGITTTAETFAVTVTTTNDAPIGAQLSNTDVDENSANGTVIGNVSAIDLDDGDSHQFALVDDANSRFTIDQNSGVLTVADSSQLNFEQATSHQITVRVTDAAGANHDETFTISVADLNEAPIGQDSQFSTTQMGEIRLDTPGLLAFAADEDGDSLSVRLVSNVSAGQLVFNADGSFTYTPNPSFEGTDSFSYRLSDGVNESAPITVSIEIEAIAPAPPSDTNVDPPDEPNDDTAGDEDTSSEDDSETDSDNDESEDNSTDGEPTTTESPSTSTVTTEQPVQVAPVVDVTTEMVDAESGSTTADELLAKHELPSSIRFGDQDRGGDNDVDRQGRVSGDHSLRGFRRTFIENPVSDFPLSIDVNHVDSGSQDTPETNLVNRELVIGTTKVVSTSLTVGYVVWMVRGGTLAASLVASLPAWTSFDPLAIVSGVDLDVGMDDGESLSDLVNGDETNGDEPEPDYPA